MDTMNVALSAEMKEFVRDKVTENGYRSPSEYIQELIRREQRRKAETRLESALLEGLDSGSMQEMTAKDWDAMRSRLKSRHAGGNRPV